LWIEHVFDRMTARTALAPGMDDRDDRDTRGVEPKPWLLKRSVDRWTDGICRPASRSEPAIC